MDNKIEENKIKEIENALIEVRKAQRLLYSYQERMLDIAKLVMTKLKFGQNLVGNRIQFSEFRNTTASKRGNIHVEGVWAWDFFYGYAFEYYMHSRRVSIEGAKYRLFASLVQITDSGHYDRLDELTGSARFEDIKHIDKYNSAENSTTDLILVLELAKDGHESSYWNINEEENRREKKEQILAFYSSKSSDKNSIADCFDKSTVVQSGQLVMKKYSASEFHSNEAIDEILNDALGDCKEIILT